jgi:hypothetical protein
MSNVWREFERLKVLKICISNYLLHSACDYWVPIIMRLISSQWTTEGNVRHLLWDCLTDWTVEMCVVEKSSRPRSVRPSERPGSQAFSATGSGGLSDCVRQSERPGSQAFSATGSGGLSGSLNVSGRHKTRCVWLVSGWMTIWAVARIRNFPAVLRRFFPAVWDNM